VITRSAKPTAGAEMLFPGVEMLFTGSAKCSAGVEMLTPQLYKL